MRGFIVEDDKRFVYLKKLLEEAGDIVEPSLLHYEKLDYIVFGLKGPDEMGHYKENSQTRLLADNFFESLQKGCKIYTFVDSPYLQRTTQKYELVYQAFEKDEQVVLGNADLTSEAVMAYLISKRARKLKDSTLTIIGYGHLAKSLIKYLQPFVKSIKVVLRNPKYDQEIKRFGTPYRFEQTDYFDSDILINTVPCRLFGKAELKKIKSDSIFLDVSSFPYSFDIDEALECQVDAHILPGLPGKYAYQDAAKLLFYAITEGRNV